jgi:hypothetical protein
MSSPLAIAGVTAVLKDLLNDGLINHNDLSPVGTFTISALPPDRIQTGANEENRINLFLYQVTPNQGWRNQGMPSMGLHGERLSNPPLALDLHYMLTAYGKEDLNAEVLLGYAMELLHDMPPLTRANIRKSLNPTNPINVNLIPKDEDGRSAADLADQIEQIKITPNFLSADELSRLWTAMQARYRPTMAYQVSTVLIQHKSPTKSPLPVIARGEKDRGIESQSNLDKPVPKGPTLTGLKIFAVLADDREIERVSAELGDVLELEGVHLDGVELTAEFSHRLFFKIDSNGQLQEQPKKIEIDMTQPQTAQKVRFSLPKATDGTTAKEWPPGQYTIALSIKRAGKKLPLSNVMLLMMAPRIFEQPTVSGMAANPKVTVKFFPEIWKKQLEDKQVEIHVGGHPFQPEPIATDTIGELTVPIVGIPASEEAIPVTLRVDGVSNELIRDRNSKELKFDSDQTITLPP